MRISDRPSLEVSFESALRSLWMAYQPIIEVGTKKLFGYEALLRTHEPSLPNPGALLSAAERLGRLADLGRAIRNEVARTLALRPEITAFVNLHTKDLADETLYALDAALMPYARRVILEITERAALDEVRDVPTRIDMLRKAGFRIAIDDLGAGYAGLTSFAQLVPEIVKLDMALVRGIDQDPIRQKLVSTMTRLCHDMQLTVVAEGIETEGERSIIEELGCDLLQGYLLGRPAPLPP
jgi:EAL domain-containing protein (putative c-di-GMP-specific phosphodiesterase class I)